MGPVGDSERRVLIIATGDHSRMSQVVKMQRFFERRDFQVVSIGDSRQVGDASRVERVPVEGRGLTRTTSSSGYRSAVKRMLKGQLFSTKFGRWLQVLVQDHRRFGSLKRQSAVLSELGIGHSPTLVLSSQWSTLAAGRRVADRLGIPLIYDARDLAGVWDQSVRSARRSIRLEHRNIARADLILAPSDGVASEIRIRHPRARSPLVIFNSGEMSAEASSEPHRPVRLLFQGYFASNRLLDELISSMGLLRDSCTLTLQGWGELEADLRKQVARLNLGECVRFVEPVEPDRAAIAAAEYDIGIINYRASTKNLLYSLPNKLFDYMGGGLAVVASNLPDLSRVVLGEDCGVVFDPTGPSAIAGAVQLLVSNPERLTECKSNSLRGWHNYSWGSLQPVLAQEIEGLYASYDRKRNE